MPLNELREPSVSIAGACMHFDGASFYAPQTKILERRKIFGPDIL